jgi:hypothetical protein
MSPIPYATAYFCQNPRRLKPGTISQMTAYKDFIEDFPCRCRDILNIAKRPALSRGREVTLTLMVASARLVVPYERFKSDTNWGDHPSGDRKTFADAAGKLESLLRQPFRSSCLWTETNSTWRVGKLLSVTGDPDSWGDLRKRQPVSKDKTVGGIISVIRNALTHGNIWTLRDPIEEIIFVKRVLNNDKVVATSTLRAWRHMSFNIFSGSGLIFL